MKKSILFILTILSAVTLSAQNRFGCLEINETNRAEAEAAISRIPEYVMPSASRGALPSMVDNSKSKYFPSIMNQVGNTCAAVSMVHYQFTYNYCVLKDLDVKASNTAFNPHFAYALANNGQDMGAHPWDIADVMKYYGVLSQAVLNSGDLYQWPNGYGTYMCALENVAANIQKFHSDKASGMTEMKRYLYDRGNGSKIGGLIQFSANAALMVHATEYTGKSESGYKAIVPKFGSIGMHSMTIVGYDDSIWWDYNENGKEDPDEIGAFICVNSWGEEWGDHGRFYAPYKTFGNDMSWKEGGTGNGGRKECFVYDIDEDYTPELVLKISMKHSSRNDISFKVTATDAEGGYLGMAEPYQFKNRGGDFPLSGKPGDLSPLEFALDLTQAGLPAGAARYRVDVTSFANGLKGDGELISCDLYDYRFDRTNPAIYKGAIENGQLQHKTTISIDFVPTVQLPEGQDAAYSLKMDNRNLHFSISAQDKAYVVADLLSLTGELMENLHTEEVDKGIQSLDLQISDKVAAGDYVLRVSINNRTEYRKITVK